LTWATDMLAILRRGERVALGGAHRADVGRAHGRDLRGAERRDAMVLMPVIWVVVSAADLGRGEAADLGGPQRSI